MILNNSRSMQIGGSMSAKTEYAPIDIKWEDVGKDVKSTPTARLPKADISGLDKYFDYKLDGLESDKTMMYDKIEGLKSKLEKGLSKDYTMDQYKSDVQRLRRLVTVGVSGLKQKELRYKDVVNASTASKSDLAINGGKAFVSDNKGNYSIIGVNEMLTKRENGKLKYSPQTVASALEHRANNPNFNAFEGSGEELEGIIRSIRSSSDIEKQIKSAFTGLGSSTQSDSGKKMIAGQSANSLVDLLEAKMFGKADKEIYTKFKEKYKSNETELNHAYNSLMSTIQSTGIMEGLKRNAYGEYMAIYGDKKSEDEAEKWVNARVMDRLNSSMLSYLKSEGATSSEAASKSGGTSGGDVNSNQLVHALAYPDVMSSPTSIYSTEGDKLSIQTPISTISDPSLFNNNAGLIRARQDRSEESVAQNSWLKELTSGSSLKDNLFLATENNLPLEQLGPDNKDGIHYAMLDQDFQPEIMHNVLTYRKPDGKMGIAWDLTHEANKMKGMSNDQLLAFIKTTNAAAKYTNTLSSLAFRKVLHTKVIIPINKTNRLGMAKEYTELFDELLYKADEVDNPRNRKLYEQKMLGENSTLPDDLGSRTLHSFNTFSILNSDDMIKVSANQNYKTDKTSMEQVASYEDERRHTIY